MLALAFGTSRNPETYTEPAGIYDGASSRLGAMLIGRDAGHPAA